MEQMNLHLKLSEHANITWEQFRIDKEFRQEHYKTNELVGDRILGRQMALLGHVIRWEPHELLRRVAIDENLQKPKQPHKRVGATRLNWMTDNRAHEQIHAESYSPIYESNNAGHVQNLIDNAQNYNFLRSVNLRSKYSLLFPLVMLEQQWALPFSGVQRLPPFHLVTIIDMDSELGLGARSGLLWPRIAKKYICAYAYMHVFIYFYIP